MGTGKTSTVVEKIINKYLIKDFKNNKLDKPAEHKILIAKPHINAGGSHEQYGFLSGDINEKLDPTLGNFIQYFDRWHPAGFNKLRESGVVQILPLGFIRGLDAENMTIIVDEAQNTKELVSVVTRKAKKNSKIILIGDTSPFQIDLEQNTTEKNGLKHIIELLSGANYFQYIEMKSIEHIVRSDEVKDIVKRLFKKYGTEGKWIV
jgi:phosphate starvation-inducible protein PhoH